MTQFDNTKALKANADFWKQEVKRLNEELKHARKVAKAAQYSYDQWRIKNE